MSTHARRSPIIYACAVGFSAWLGLQARRYGYESDSATPIVEYAGAAFWALAIFASTGFFFPTIATWQAAVATLVVGATLEYAGWSQSPWLVAMRGTPLGELVLGTDSVATDLTGYAVGAGLGMLIELWALD